MQRQAGLLYTQLYSSGKEVFAAGDAYPFTNPALDTLALDPQLSKTWQHVGGGLSHNPVALMRAYLHMKQRCHAALQGSYLKVFGFREEHRVSLRLYSAIDQELRHRHLHDTRLPGVPSTVEPFYSLPTPTLLLWFHWNVNKFCVGFEAVYSINDRHFVTWEHTRMMMMFLRCLQFSYTGGLLQRVSGCWRDVWFRPDARRTDGLRRCEGLGSQRSMEASGYAWFLDKVDWDTMTFRQPSAQYMMFNSPLCRPRSTRGTGRFATSATTSYGCVRSTAGWRNSARSLLVSICWKSSSDNSPSVCFGKMSFCR